jgi:hypothetical protein
MLNIGFVMLDVSLILFGIRNHYFLFGSVFIKKNNQIEIFFRKKLKPVQTDWFRFGSVF